MRIRREIIAVGKRPLFLLRHLLHSSPCLDRRHIAFYLPAAAPQSARLRPTPPASPVRENTSSNKRLGHKFHGALREANAEIQPGGYFNRFDCPDNINHLVVFFIVRCCRHLRLSFLLYCAASLSAFCSGNRVVRHFRHSPEVLATGRHGRSFDVPFLQRRYAHTPTRPYDSPPPTRRYVPHSATRTAFNSLSARVYASEFGSCVAEHLAK